MLSKGLALVVLLFTLQVVTALDEPAKQYSAGKYVKRYGKDGEFPNAAEATNDDWNSYLRERLTPAVVVIVFAVIAVCCCQIINCICCCCPMEKGVCAPQSWTQEKPGKQICTILMFLTLAIVAALVFYGFANENNQYDSLENVPNVFDDTLELVQKSRTAVYGFGNATLNMSDAVDSISGTTCPASQLEDIQRELDEIEEQIESGSNSNDLNQQLDEVESDIKKLTEDSDSISDINKQRRDAILSILILLLLVTICSAGIGFCNSAEKCTQENSAKIQCATSSFILFIVFLALFLSAVIYAGVLVFGDICYDPTRVLIEINEFNAGDDSSNSTEDLTYYLKCVDDSSLTSPLQGQIDDINANLQELKAQVALLPPNCRDTPQGNLNDHVDGLLYRADGTGKAYNGATSDDQLFGDEGLLGCYELNAVYQNLFFDICKDFYDPFAIAWEIFFVIGFFMLLVELIAKCLMTNDSDGVQKPVAV